jgi:penicillin-binding protein 2
MLTPQLARRVTLLGSFALAMFGILFFRLWFLQVLSGQHYLAQASVNGSVRDISVPAPRGDVLDRAGNLLVDNTRALDVQVSVPNLAKAGAARSAEYHRLASILRMSTKARRCPVAVAGHKPVVKRLAAIPCAVAQQQAAIPYANVTIKTNVSRDLQFYLLERQNLYPGVEVKQVYQRS